jgi:hypothetical protein
LLRLDLLFIDGDPSYEGVKADFVNYSQLVRPGGLIGFMTSFLISAPATASPPATTPGDACLLGGNQGSVPDLGSLSKIPGRMFMASVSYTSSAMERPHVSLGWCPVLRTVIETKRLSGLFRKNPSTFVSRRLP